MGVEGMKVLPSACVTRGGSLCIPGIDECEIVGVKCIEYMGS